MTMMMMVVTMCVRRCGNRLFFGFRYGHPDIQYLVGDYFVSARDFSAPYFAINVRRRLVTAVGRPPGHRHRRPSVFFRRCRIYVFDLLFSLLSLADRCRGIREVLTGTVAEPVRPWRQQQHFRRGSVYRIPTTFRTTRPPNCLFTATLLQDFFGGHRLHCPYWFAGEQITAAGNDTVRAPRQPRRRERIRSDGVAVAVTAAASRVLGVIIAIAAETSRILRVVTIESRIFFDHQIGKLELIVYEIFRLRVFAIQQTQQLIHLINFATHFIRRVDFQQFFGFDIVIDRPFRARSGRVRFLSVSLYFVRRFIGRNRVAATIRQYVETRFFFRNVTIGFRTDGWPA